VAARLSNRRRSAVVIHALVAPADAFRPIVLTACSVNDLLQRQLYLRASEGVAALCSFHGIVKDV
jgi:hypothetical protein